MHINFRKLLILGRPHLTGEYDVASFFELPAKELYDLRNKPSIELLDSLYHIIKEMAIKEYTSRVDNVLSERQKYILSVLANDGDMAVNSIMNPAIGYFFNNVIYERAVSWFDNCFKLPLINAMVFVENKEFAAEFEKVLLRIIMLRDRQRKLQKMEKKCFFKKKQRVKKLIRDIDIYLCDKSVGFYGVMLYGFTLYSERSSNYLMFDMRFRRE